MAWQVCSCVPKDAYRTMTKQHNYTTVGDNYTPSLRLLYAPVLTKRLVVSVGQFQAVDIHYQHLYDKHVNQRVLLPVRGMWVRYAVLQFARS